MKEAAKAELCAQFQNIADCGAKAPSECIFCWGCRITRKYCSWASARFKSGYKASEIGLPLEFKICSLKNYFLTIKEETKERNLKGLEERSNSFILPLDQLAWPEASLQLTLSPGKTACRTLYHIIIYCQFMAPWIYVLPGLGCPRSSGSLEEGNNWIIRNHTYYMLLRRSYSVYFLNPKLSGFG